MSPRRKKHLYGRKKSFSVEQEAGAGLRRVEFDEESLARKSERRGTGGQCSPRSSPKRVQPPSPGVQAAAIAGYSSSREELHSGAGDYSKRRLQWRMKSFSLDTPDPGVALRHHYDGGGGQSDRSSAFRKSPSPNPVAYSGHGVPSSSGTGSSGDVSGRKRLERSSGSFDAHGMSGYGGPSSQGATSSDPSQRGATSISWRHNEGRLSGNLYVVMYDFLGRRRDELDLKSGWKVSAIDTSDPDWWTGMCNGKVGFFPSAYVQRLRPGDQVWRVSHPLQLNDQRGNTVKLFRGQIVIQAGLEDHGMIPVRLRGGIECICPIRYLQHISEEA